VVNLGDLGDDPICLRCGGSTEWTGQRWRHLGTVPDRHPVVNSTTAGSGVADMPADSPERKALYVLLADLVRRRDLARAQGRTDYAAVAVARIDALLEELLRVRG
jgi:hypothetical protein